LVLHGIPGQAPEPGRRPAGCAFAPRCALAADACLRSMPPLVALAPDHSVRCVQAGAQERVSARASPQPDRAAKPASSVLQVENLVAWHGARRILHGIGFDVPERACVALVGESGSGKTTLARCIAGLHRELGGTMRYRGRELAIGSRARPPELRRRIQYIFQNPYASLNPRRTIGQSIAIALHAFEPASWAATRQRVEAVLEQVALPGFAAKRHPHQLSGGQRQRAAIARALILEPELLICDEVTSALDVSVQAVVVELLGRLQRERGLAMLFVTHNLALVRSIAQQVAVLQGGRIVELGEVARVLERPEAAETRRLIEDAPRFPAALEPHLAPSMAR
jgi:peptide/nickel transport system ATP-binding protein